MKRFNPLKSTTPSAEPLTAPRKAPQPPGATEFTVTLTENHQKDGLELRFPRKPDDATLDLLKANHWRWSRFSSCWYHRNTPENRTFANRFLKLAASAGLPPVPTVSPEPETVSPEAQIVPPPAPIVSPVELVSNILTVQFSPETTFPVIPQRPVALPPKPIPAWRRALMGR